jgi:hypothetical protein
MSGKSKSKVPGTNPVSAMKIQREAAAEQAKMRDMARRPEKKGGKLLKGNRRRSG